MGVVQNPRPSPIAGTWYPGTEQALRRSVDEYLSAVLPTSVQGEIKAITVPHAGHHYSGKVAAHAYRSVQGMPTHTVAVVSPMHQYHPGRLITTAHDAYVTPLGMVPVNHELISQLDQIVQISIKEGLTPVPRDQEHSLEIQLPFLQRVFQEGFDLVPIMLRDQSPSVARILADALLKTLPEGTLLVASSDLSHFFPESEAKQLDDAVLEAINGFSPEDLYRVEADSRGFACGLGAIATILWTARGLGADKVAILDRATSGDVTGDLSSVVGYASAVIYKSQ
ncbi:MAG: AmmeMemoRadiSam system protein B [Anaerolineaceae bacterium]|nr:AmmeMemoRadiSam system protein B [Anaerolineaceae bacterium]